MSHSVRDHTNTELKPSGTNSFPWLYEQNEAMKEKYNYGNECGKWMMFFNIGPQLDEKWAEARKLYNEGKLIGIHSMKVGTLYGGQNPLLDEENVNMVRVMVGLGDQAELDYDDPDVIEAFQEVLGVDPARHRKKDGTFKEGNKMAPIIFYCGPATNEKLMMEYGHNLVKQMPYYNPNGHIYYKSDAQTAMGSRATGQLRNHLYKIPVSREREPQQQTQSEEHDDKAGPSGSGT